MPISERTLRKWRKEALIINNATDIKDKSRVSMERRFIVERSNAILRLTQELLDQHLLRK